jgi:hypothetical protein
MLENTKHRTDIQNTSDFSFRKAWSKIFRSFFNNTKNIQGGLQGVGEPGIPRTLDAEILSDVPPIDKIEIMEINNEEIINEPLVETRDSKFAKHKFEWVKTERAGDVCAFSCFEKENDVEYVCFSDNTRIRTEFIGDIVLMHLYENEILGREILVDSQSPILQHLRTESVIEPIVEPEVVRTHEIPSKLEKTNVFQDPVVSILDKSKKKIEKLTLTINVKIPSVELYNVIKENFDNTEEILLDSVMEQLHEKLLREAVKREIQNIYSTKKKKS